MIPPTDRTTHMRDEKKDDSCAGLTGQAIPDVVESKPRTRRKAANVTLRANNEHPWIKRGPYPGPEHTGMPIPDDPIVGHSTFRDGHHEPIRQSEAEAIIATSDRAKALRAEQMPDEQTAINVLFDAWLRLKELGWREAQYCPKDGQLFDVIEAGSTGIHHCRYNGQWPTGGWWIVGDDDLYPSRPVLFRALPLVGSHGTEPVSEASGPAPSEAP